MFLYDTTLYFFDILYESFDFKFFIIWLIYIKDLYDTYNIPTYDSYIEILFVYNEIKLGFINERIQYLFKIQYFIFDIIIWSDY